MSAPSPKGYQREAVNNALEIFRYAESQIQAAPDAQSRAAATAYNGCTLLEAPTGSGKTLMAGMIAEAFARADHRHNAKIVWFWFTPFAGLVEQAKIALKTTFQGLRIRDLQADRVAVRSRTGDVFVATWASVAASNKNTRKIRQNGDLSVALDEFIPALRGMDFRIGVVVDEAHHGFTAVREAVNFYRETMQPDFTLLITATPDDKDVDGFKDAVGIGELHRIKVSRKDAVDAGLIKRAIKSVAYLAADDQKALVDFGMTALTDAWQMHTAIRQGLAGIGVDLVPLMLVQVSSSDNSVQEARKRLRLLGVPEEAIASYTADEPDDDLIAVARDESKEVLIFKMAVALGFDAPRAFTLVSMRGARDTDFGIQVVGRILRVHRRLQGKTMPDLLQHGYVFLADAENQTGLTNAADKINAIRTEMSSISPYTMLVRVMGQTEIQVVQNGQSSLLPTPLTLPAWPAIHGEGPAATYAPGDQASTPQPSLQPGLLSGLVLAPPLGTTAPAAGDSVNKTALADILAGNRTYQIKQGFPRTYKTERLPISTRELLDCIGARIAIDDHAFSAGLRKTVKVTRCEEEIFARQVLVDTIQARLSDTEIARRAQRVMFEPDYLDPRDLYETLSKRLRHEYDQRGMEVRDTELRRALYLIMVSFPSIVRRAARECAANFKEVVDTRPLPESVGLPPGAQSSALNIYGVMPDELTEPERKFAEMLDTDTSGMVQGWFRNEPRKPWSIGIVLPSGDRYFPDFAIKVKGRTRGDGLLLVEIKGNHILNGDDTLDKTVAEHKIYKRPLMIVQEDTGRFMTIKYNEQKDKNELDAVFYIGSTAQY